MSDAQWDTYDAYLFDIDGTLLVCRDAVHYFAFIDALSAVAGTRVTLDGVTVQGSTDARIIRDAMAMAGVKEELWKHRLPEILRRMREQVRRNRGQFDVQVQPGVIRVLTHLRNRNALLGVGTGNLEAIGWLKLEAAGLREYFQFGSFCDAHEVRADMVRCAADHVQEMLNGSASLCVVGDTPADIEGARARGLDAIAVATGIYSREELEAHNPLICVDTLDDLFAGVPATLQQN